MAKRADSTYCSGERTTNWLKIKTTKRQEAVIAGFTAPRGSRPHFGALVLAVRDGKQWRYVGNVGAGFSHAMLAELHRKLTPLVTASVAVHNESQESGRYDVGKTKTRC